MKELRKIEGREAFERYRIKMNHALFDNGELRFRLESYSDKTSYIRTVSVDKSYWQESHVHSYLRETYIVQEGWIVYATLSNKNKYTIMKYGVNEQFTTYPDTVHSIFMSKGSVIHTVKHGSVPEGINIDRITGNQSTKYLDTKLQSISIKMLEEMENDSSFNRNNVTSTIYGEDYKHFDNLIWQLPIWFTALFALAFTKIPFSLQSYLLHRGYDWRKSNSIAYFAIGIIFFLFSYTLFRFRYHQSHIKPYRLIRKKIYFISPQIYLNFILNIQGSFFWMMSFITSTIYSFQVSNRAPLTILFGIPCFLSLIFEISLFNVVYKRKGFTYSS